MGSKLEILLGDVEGDSEIKSLCHHHWIIEPPNGSSSRGVCKFCKEERVFNNSVDRYFIRKPRGKDLSSGTRAGRKESLCPS